MQKLTLSAMFTALIAVLAQFAIPLPFSPVPFTGQVIGVLLAGSLLGRRAGFLSIFAYLALGAAGAPIFSMGRGGIYMLLGPTGGYLWGFMPAVYISAMILGKADKRSHWQITMAVFAALGMIYVCGALQLALVMGYSLKQVLLVGVIPFIPLDLLKVALTVFLSKQIWNSLCKNQLSHMLEN